MTIVEREEKYLLMLRRATLGFARLLLVLSAVALIGGIGMYAWAEFNEAGVTAFTLKTSALMAGYAAATLFACFLLLMLVFVFIKIEVDLRDIRNAIKEDHAIVQPLVGAEEMQQTLPSFVDARPQKGIIYTDSELEAMRSAGGKGH
jgi:hypothetical protein